MKKQLSVVVTGELDCGKSTLIGRFLFDTGSIPKEAERELRQAKEPNFALFLDSFQEERLGQFTLDTTQVSLKNKKSKYMFIDVPGHRELLKNMLTGASYADVAILVVDVRKGLEEQTRRHLYILKFLGIEPIIVVLNKMDLVYYKKQNYERVLNEIKIFFKKIKINPFYIIPISAKEGQGLLKKSNRMAWYKGPFLLKALDDIARKEKTYDFRLPVQDIYEIKGESIITGKVISGKINVEDKVKVLLINKELKIKQIKTFGKRSKSQAKSPESIGLKLGGKEKLKRGYVLYKGKPPRFTKQILAKIFCIKPLNIQEILTLHCSTQEVQATIFRIDSGLDTKNFKIHKNLKVLKETDVAQVLITLDKPIVMERFYDLPELGRFILQKDSEICAVGIIS